MQAKRAANRAARKEAALNGPATKIKSQSKREIFLAGYFDVIDGKQVSIESLPDRRHKEDLQNYRDRLYDFNPYLAGAWTAQRALATGYRLKGYKGRQSPPDELERWDQELRKREADDIKAAKRRRETIDLLMADIAGPSISPTLASD